MPKVLVVFNTCEINGSENWTSYLPSIQNLLNQDFNEFVLVVSGCKMTSRTKEKLLDTFGSKIAYNWIDEILPLNVTFNHTVRKCWDHYGDFDSVLYVDSGVNTGDDRFVIERLYRRYATGKFSMIAHRTDTDTGYNIWDIPVYPSQDTVIPVGKTVNLHCQMFGREVYETYDRRILPDIFASDTSESIYSFMCAGTNRRMVLCHENWIHHRVSLDGASSGFRFKKPLLFRCKHGINDICNEGYQYGFGYEEVVAGPINGAIGHLGRHHHNPDWYNPDGSHKDPQAIAKFIREWCFIEGYHYDHIISDFLPSQSQDIKIKSPAITCVLHAKENIGRTIETIESVMSQTFPDFELVVHDGGRVIQEIPHDKRVKVIRTTHDIVGSFSSGLSDAKGHMIMYLTEEDVLYPCAFEAFVEHAKKNPQDKAMYATQDLVAVDDGEPFFLGERQARDTRGRCVGGRYLEGQIDLAQVCHVVDPVRNSRCWAGSPNQGKFLESVGNKFPVVPIDAKIGMKKLSK